MDSLRLFTAELIKRQYRDDDILAIPGGKLARVYAAPPDPKNHPDTSRAQ